MHLHKSIFPFVIVILLFITPDVSEARTNSATGPHIEVSLLSDLENVVPGESITFGVLLSPETQWHTYWRNPGDSGEQPKIEWSSNVDIAFGDIRWPIPKAIPVAHLVNYGYEGENLLLVDAVVPNEIGQQIVNVTADISWLVCKEDCIPGWATLSLDLPVSAVKTVSKHADYFDHTERLLPQWTAITGSYEITEEHVVVSFSRSLTEGIIDEQLSIFPFRGDTIQHAAEQTWTQIEDDVFATLNKSEYFPSKIEQLEWLVSDGKRGFYLRTSPNQLSGYLQGEHQEVLKDLSSIELLKYLLFAILGGLILNLMPCVLPVISLKAMAMQQVENNANKLGYPMGVLVSFVAFALLIIVLRHSGEQLGWGFHMQSPMVIGGLAFLFVFISLMLLDIAPTGSRFSGAGHQLTIGQGFSSQFFTGVLAVVVASPCTAPFMAAAMGIAFISDDMTTLLLFIGLALGFALPLSALAFFPKISQRLPKPGPWMDSFRQFLVFPMLATVVWLLWVYQAQTSNESQIILLSALLLFSALLWLSSKLNSLAKYIICVLALGVVIFTLRPVNKETSDYVIPYSAETLQELRQKGETVLVNMTADWCITCKVNEQIAFTDNDVKTLLASDNVHYMVGDWTNKNEEILNFLKKYERSGVPLYVVFKDDSEKVLPQILTPQILLNELR